MTSPLELMCQIVEHQQIIDGLKMELEVAVGMPYDEFTTGMRDLLAPADPRTLTVVEP